MTAWTSPRIQSIADAFAEFVDPAASTYPTPLFWWSGADLTRPKLEWQLDQLKNKGIGGTIVGYSHLPDGSLDHGNPAPFTEEWWHLLRWFVEASAERGLTTGIQDYGIIGTVLKSVATRTSGLKAGTLSNVVAEIAIGEQATLDTGHGELVSVIAWPASGSIARPIALDPLTLTSPAPEWVTRKEPWHISGVVRTRGKIGLDDTDFDPLHPDSGAAVIDTFYATFDRELGDRFGTSFRMFFQDELDLGITMPMWNDAVAGILAGEFVDPHMVHALWHNLGEGTLAFRALYRDTVVGMLSSNYFRPIYEWLDARGVLLVMDQISRGDLRLGHSHYADFLDTMQWYHGPGNDDPDLRGPRGTAAFAISSSIARAADRPLVVNEGFHSSGWAVSPSAIIAGANVGFASGANHLIMHGLNYTTEAGWWEWASPDFHFRQPWWAHSAPLWKYFARVSSLLRCGRDAQEVAVLDPSSDLDLAPGTDSPELARELLTALRLAGLPALAVSPATLDTAVLSARGIEVGGMPLRLIVVPGMHTMRDSTLEVLARFIEVGGEVIAVDRLPAHTETRRVDDCATAGWTIVLTTADAVAALRTRPTLAPASPGLMVAHRRVDDADMFFLVNSTDVIIESPFLLADPRRRTEFWDAWSGVARPAPRESADAGVSLSVLLRLEPGRSEILVIHDETEEVPPAVAQARMHAIAIPDSWTIEYLNGLANTFHDFSLDDRDDLGVETVRFAAGNAPARTDIGTRFFLLGPIEADDSAAVEAELLAADPDFGVPIAGLAWRPYNFSPTSGLDDDPLQRDPMTGPHGLKGVRDDFLDPAAVDPAPQAGSHYYFGSRIPTPDDSEIMRAGSRAQHAVWVDGRLALDSGAEQPAAWFPPWSLRDLRIKESTARVDTAREFATVLVRMTVSATQPTRGYVAVGGGGAASPSVAAMRWWQGDDPARPFQPHAGQSREVKLTVTIPRGARQAVVESLGPVVSASVQGTPLAVTSQEVTPARGEPHFLSTVILPADPLESLELTMRATVDLGDTGGVVTSPIRWTTAAVSAPLAPWRSWGLGDFSGRLRYTTTFSVAERSRERRLRLEGLVGSAAVALNGSPLGVLFDDATTLDLSAAILDGENVLTIECANTLGNYYSRWPTPYASTADAGGGFLRAWLVLSGA